MTHVGVVGNILTSTIKCQGVFLFQTDNLQYRESQLPGAGRLVGSLREFGMSSSSVRKLG